MHSGWFRKNFLRVFKFLQIKDGGPNFWGEQMLQKDWIIWSPSLYKTFKSIKNQKSASVTRFQCILHHSEVPFEKFKRDDLVWLRRNFLRVLKFLQIKEGRCNLRGEQILQNGPVRGSPVLHFNLKISETQNLRFP